VDDYIRMVGSQVSGAFDFSANDEVSIALWIKGTNTTQNNRGIVSNSGGGKGFALTMFNNYIRWRGYILWAGYDQLFDGEWHLLVVNSNLTTTLLYMDGVQKASGESAELLAPNKDLDIATYESDTSRAFNAMIDEVRVYNRVLSASEVSELYRAGARKFVR